VNLQCKPSTNNTLSPSGGAVRLCRPSLQRCVKQHSRCAFQKLLLHYCLLSHNRSRLQTFHFSICGVIVGKLGQQPSKLPWGGGVTSRSRKERLRFVLEIQGQYVGERPNCLLPPQQQVNGLEQPQQHTTRSVMPCFQSALGAADDATPRPV
jgi:hypothetical protein